ncbi:hypothetical protein HYR99_05690 [Candidatus Poribacteria bacterium]|nr:hypothetical protein [Candidatus Poribacteria bacterium]
MRLIDEQYTRTPFYGVLKVTAWLKTQGYRVNRSEAGSQETDATDGARCHLSQAQDFDTGRIDTEVTSSFVLRHLRKPSTQARRSFLTVTKAVSSHQRRLWIG